MRDNPPPAPDGGQAQAAGRADVATQVFTDHRELLFAIVYNLLGSVADTEDVLQETWLAWAGRAQDPGAAPIANPRGYLVRVAVNQALARQAAIRRRRETYVGPWLPEPLLTGADAADPAVRAETVSVALLVVLETLSPLERAVFVLHEVFGYPHAEIAAMLDRSPQAVRQLGHRAREHVHARRPRFRADPQLQHELTRRFIAATVAGDLAGLLELLAPEVTLWADAGGKLPRAALRPVQGRDRVARFMTGVASRGLPSQPSADLEFRYLLVNGDPAVLLFEGGAPFAVIVLDLTRTGDQVQTVYAIGNPDKLTNLRRSLQQTQEPD